MRTSGWGNCPFCLIYLGNGRQFGLQLLFKWRCSNRVDAFLLMQGGTNKKAPEHYNIKYQRDGRMKSKGATKIWSLPPRTMAEMKQQPGLQWPRRVKRLLHGSFIVHAVSHFLTLPSSSCYNGPNVTQKNVQFNVQNPQEAIVTLQLTIQARFIDRLFKPEFHSLTFPY